VDAMQRRWKIYAGIAFLAVVADQLTKVWARSALPVDGAGRGVRVSVVENFFDLVLAHNTGAAFSLLADHSGGRVLLTLLGVVGVGAITWMAARARPDQVGLVAALGLMVGGAIGNLVDRIRLGTVTDFVLWRWHEHTWPVFNVADVCLSVAIGIFAAHSLRTLSRGRSAA
jgi:signal peptidase II